MGRKDERRWDGKVLVESRRWAGAEPHSDYCCLVYSWTSIVARESQHRSMNLVGENITNIDVFSINL